jgi:hypothetical protein
MDDYLRVFRTIKSENGKNVFLPERSGEDRAITLGGEGRLE